MLTTAAMLAGCNKLAHQSSVYVRLNDETKAISDLANGLSSQLKLAAYKAEFEYGGPDGRQTVYKLIGLSKVIFVQTESATFCEEPDPDRLTFNDRLLVVNLGASTTEGLAESMAALRQVSEANRGTLFTDSNQVCGQSG